jgi:hypothetical protein
VSGGRSAGLAFQGRAYRPSFDQEHGLSPGQSTRFLSPRHKTEICWQAASSEYRDWILSSQLPEPSMPRCRVLSTASHAQERGRSFTGNSYPRMPSCRAKQDKMGATSCGGECVCPRLKPYLKGWRKLVVNCSSTVARGASPCARHPCISFNVSGRDAQPFRQVDVSDMSFCSNSCPQRGDFRGRGFGLHQSTVKLSPLGLWDVETSVDQTSPVSRLGQCPVAIGGMLLAFCDEHSSYLSKVKSFQR